VDTSISLRSRCVWIATLLALVCAPVAFGQAPTLSKAFAPTTIGPGSTAALNFIVTNPSSSPVRNVAFSDTLPAGMTIAPGASTDCANATLGAPEGGSTISFSSTGLPASNTCTVRVNVTAAAAGTYNNTSSAITSDNGSGGTASASLTVNADRPGFSKTFSPDSVFFNGRSRLTFNIDNSASSVQRFQFIFSDNLPAGVTVASPANASNSCGGTLSAAAGSSSISLSPAGGPLVIIPAGGSCSVGVDVIGGSVGTHVNVSGDLTSNTNSGFNQSSGLASDTLTVSIQRLSIEKSFTDDPVLPGGAVNLRFTIRNLDRRSSASNIAFSDDLDAALSGLAAVSLPSNPCGSGSSITGSSVISLTGGNLSAEGSCTFDVGLAVPSGAAPGTYTNTTDAVSGDVGGSPTTGNAASDDLFVITAPVLTKSYVDDPVGAGDTVTLEFSITNPSSTDPMTDIAFDDTFDDVIESASSVPGNDLCGVGSSSNFIPRIDSTTGNTPARFFVSGGSLAAGATCTFSLVLDLSQDVPSGSFENVTSDVTATYQGVTVSGPPASDTLEIVAGVQLQKEFLNDPVAAGSTVVLRFTLALAEASPGSASGIAFTDNLSAVIPGLVATGLPMSACGGSIDGTGTLSFSGGSLNPAEECDVDVTLQVPASADPGSYPNTTSSVVSTVLGVDSTQVPAVDELDVAGLTLTKTAIGSPVRPGGTVTFSFTVANVSPGTAITDIQFSDNIDAALDGMSWDNTGFPMNDVCGSGSVLLVGGGGNSTLTLLAGGLTAGTSCTFQADAVVPLSAADAGYENTTGSVFATVSGSTAAFPGAQAAFDVVSEFLVLEKEFLDDPVAPGGTVELQFTLTNTDTVNPVTGLAFTDDLEAALSGLVSISGTQNDVCGTGSTLSGTSTLTLAGGSLPAGRGCVFSATLQVPNDVLLGESAFNQTSQVTGDIGGTSVFGQAAEDTLVIDFVDFSKAFSGDASPSGTVDLTFTIQNLDSSNGISQLEFSDDLDAVLSGLVSVSGTQTGVCGASSTFSGTSVLELTDGSLLPGGSCTFGVTLSVPASAGAGSYANETSDLFQNGLRVADRATAVLTVIADVDADDDGVDDAIDACPNTVVPEGVPTQTLGTNRFALVDGDFTFDTKAPNGNGPQATFTLEDTKGCSCEQIIEILELGSGHTKKGCSLGAMRDFVELVN